MRILFSILIMTLVNVQVALGQNSLTELRSEISFYSDIVANAALSSTKAIANDKLISVMETFLSTEGSFEVPLESDIWISVKGPEDNSWRILTWECEAESSINYHGYIQTSGGGFVKMSDHADEMGDISYDILDQDYWFGALYYNLIEETDDSGVSYFLLFGFNRKDQYTNRKVVDVLTFKDGKPVFGKPVFKIVDAEGAEDDLYRIYLEYSSDSNVTLNYNVGMGMIVYDHLISRMGRMEGQGPTMLPDGSYCGYKLENGKWIYIDKLFDMISETPPMPKPVIDKNKGRDLFGKKKKN